MQNSVLSTLFRNAPHECARLLAWYLYPIRFAHPDRLKEEFGEYLPLIQGLCRGSRRYERALSKVMLQRRGVDRDETITNCEVWMLRDGTSWERLFLWLGLIRYGASIAQEIRGERVRQLRRLLGEQGYRFAVKKVPFFGQLASIRKPLPEDLTHLARQCLQEGVALFRKAVEPLPEFFCSRLDVLVPRDWISVWNTAETSVFSKDEAAKLLRRLFTWERGCYG